MASALRDSDVDLIGICGRKFTRLLVLAGLVAGVLAICGGCCDVEEGSAEPTATTPAETAAAETTPTEAETEPQAPETTTQPMTTPEETPGGAGDEEPARTLALFIARGGRITPRVVRVPAFISVK